MTQRNRLVLSHYFRIQNSGYAALASGEFSDSWIPQIDITIIGAQILSSVDYTALALAEAGGHRIDAVLTRAAGRGDDSRFLALNSGARHEAAPGAVGCDVMKDSDCMFPEGYGIDVDSGEAVNFLAINTSLQAAQAIDFNTEAHVLYVQR